MDLINFQSEEVVISLNTIEKIEWPLISNKLTIDRNIRCVYVVNIPDLIRAIPFLTNFLDELEVNKSKKYYRVKDQQQYIISKGILKIILSRYLNIKPEKIDIELGKNNKPKIAGTSNLIYNVSHTDGLTIIAIHSRSIGIDIEKINFKFNYKDILSNSFNKEECDNIEKSNESTLQFYKLWTRKEALIKGTSLGINDVFKHIPSLDGKHYINSHTIESNENWSVDSYNLNNEYICSIAYPANSSSTVYFQKVDENLLVRLNFYPSKKL